MLIRALPLCRVRHPAVVIGDDRNSTTAAVCKRLAEGLGVLGQIRFVGKKSPQDMLPLLVQSGHVQVMPSVWDEPFSIVVLEGMGVGLPVIAADTVGTVRPSRTATQASCSPAGMPRRPAAVIDRVEGDRAPCAALYALCQRVLLHLTLARLADQVEEGLSKFLPGAQAGASRVNRRARKHSRACIRWACNSSPQAATQLAESAALVGDRPEQFEGKQPWVRLATDPPSAWSRENCPTSPSSRRSTCGDCNSGLGTSVWTNGQILTDHGWRVHILYVSPRRRTAPPSLRSATC